MLETCPLQEKDSTFQGFVIHASNLLSVFLAYCKVRIAVPNARHIMCAFNVAGEQDSCDNGEHHGGFNMLKILKNTRRNNIALFITRQAGVDHLGAKHFDIIHHLTNELFQILDNSSSKQLVDKGWVACNTTDHPPPVQRLQCPSAPTTLQDANQTSLKAIHTQDFSDDWSESTPMDM